MSAIKQKNLRGTTLTNYIEWLQNPAKHHTVGIGNGPDRPPATALYLHPFNLKMPASMIARATALETSYQSLSAQLDGYTFVALPANTTARSPAQFSPARIVHRTGRSSKATTKVSRITGNSYGNYGGTSKSAPFGKTTAAATEDEGDNFFKIRQKFLADGIMPAGHEVTLIKEKFTAKT